MADFVLSCGYSFLNNVVLPGGLGREASPNNNMRLASKVGLSLYYGKAAEWHSLPTSMGGTVDLSRFVVENQRQEGVPPPMKKAFGFLLHRNQRDFWYFWSQKYVQRANTVRPYTEFGSMFNNLQIIKQNSTIH